VICFPAFLLSLYCFLFLFLSFFLWIFRHCSYHKFKDVNIRSFSLSFRLLSISPNSLYLSLFLSIFRFILILCEDSKLRTVKFWPEGLVFCHRHPMGGLVISRAACRSISAHRRTTTHISVVSSVLCTGYVVNKIVYCVLMNMILVTII
jgi:hypothetical protein